MNCPICNHEMKNTTGGNYNCPSCGYSENDLVYRGSKTVPDFNQITPNQSTEEKQNNLKLTGWICPKCNRGISPFVDVCPCTSYNNTISVNGGYSLNDISGTSYNNTNIHKLNSDIGKVTAHVTEITEDVNDVVNTLQTML